MFFLKPKHKSDKILPPPPPFPAMEFEEEPNASEPTLSQLPQEPEISDEIEKPKKGMAEVLPEEKEFEGLFKGFSDKSKPKKAVRIEKISVKKRLAAKGPKIPKKAVKQAKLDLAKKMPIRKTSPIKAVKEKKPIKLKEMRPLKQAGLFKKIKPKKLIIGKPIKQIEFPIKKIKEKMQLPLKKIKISKKTIKKTVKPKEIKPKSEEDFGFKNIEFELSKDLEKPEKGIELQETPEDFDIENVGRELDIEGLGEELEQEAKKPNEILEAEEEIKSAIEKIKSKEKPSFFKKLFAKREKEKPEEIHPGPEVNGVSIIQNGIKKAKDALMKFDLETAKMNYIEIIRIYNNIGPEEQAKVYHDVRELYFERKSAEELKV